MKINGGGGLCIEYKVTLLFYKNAVNYKYMYNFVYLFFFNIISFIVQANYIGIKLLYIGMNIPTIRKTFILHVIWKTYSTTPMMLIFIDQLCFKETQFYTK